jgi:hypothetical protein
MKHRFLLAIAGIFFLASACSDFLEEKSQDEVIPKTTTDFRELLLGSGYIGNTDPSNFIYYMDDDVTLNFAPLSSGGYQYVGKTAAIESFPRYTWQPYYADANGFDAPINENPASTPYAAYYERVKGCNAVLDYIDGAIGTRQERDRVKAEALATRAYYYFQLVNLYGEPYSHDPGAPGVPLKLHSGVEEEIERSSVATVYEQVAGDLAEAARLMDPLAIVRRDYHVNQPAIHILLSRVYLHMERWEDCIREADKAFEQGTALTDTATLRAICVTTGPYGNTVIGSYLTYNNPEVEWIFGGNPQAEQSAYMPDHAFLAEFDQENDLRFVYGISVQEASGVALLPKLTGAGALKQSIRAAEAVLNRAEARARSNSLPGALEDLNYLRRARVVGYVDENITDQAALLDAIRLERRKEFCYEGFRWFDLRRYGMPAITHRYQADETARVEVFTLAEKDPMYTLPLPNSLLLRNPALVQNDSRGEPNRTGIPE